MNLDSDMKRYTRRIAMVLLIALMPFFIIDLYKNLQTKNRALEHQIEQAKIEMERLIKLNYQMVNSAKRDLSILALNRELLSNEDRCKEILSFTKDVSSMYENMAVVDINGKFYCSIMPHLKRVSPQAEIAHKRAIETKNFSIGDGAVVSQNHGLPIIAYAQPILDSYGEVLAVIMAGGSLTWFNETILKEQKNTQSRIFILDRHDHVVGTYPSSPMLVGKKIPQNLMPLEGSHVLKSQYEEGIKIIYYLDDFEIEQRAFKTFIKSMLFFILILIFSFVIASIIAKKLILNEVKKLLEATIAQSKFVATSELLHNISHQWRQPLNVISISVGNIEELISTNMSEDDVEYCLNRVESISNTLQNLSKKINDFSNFFKEDTKKSNFKISDATKNAISYLSPKLEANNIKTVVECHGYELFGAVNGFTQILIALIDNSIDAIIKEHRERREIKIVTQKERESLTLIIEDSGGGISQKVINKLFEPYITTKFKSSDTGLSLFIAKTIIEREMGGTIRAKNIEEGARFEISLPINSETL